MSSSLDIRYGQSLRALNTFGIDAKAAAYLQVSGLDDLRAVRADATLSALRRLVLGGGSNLLLTQDFDGLVLHMVNTGIVVSGEDDNKVYVTAQAGEHWLVFVQALRDRAVVLEVLFALPKRWQPNLRYLELATELQSQHIPHPTASDISNAVIAIRRRKLPDPATLGNAGSFFKNPVVTQVQCRELLAKYPQLICYPQPDGSVKLAAGWLIDQCGWKGKSLGQAGVHEKQALVLVNLGGATGEDIMALASSIQAEVVGRFDVLLEPEPVVI